MAKAINLIISDPVKRANLERRYWPKVIVAGPDECWEWSASKQSHGYGRMTAGRGIYLKAHQIGWVLANGAIPDGLSVCHSCDNPGCSNPSHLFLGTTKDNMQDSIKKGRSSSPPHRWGETSNKAKFTEAQALEIIADVRSHTAIARQYGVNRETIGRLKRGKTWKKLKRMTRNGDETK